MGKLLWILPLCLVLMGCREAETLETVDDEWMVPVMASPREISLELPQDAVMPVLEQEDRKLYTGQGYEIRLETVSAGDLNETIRNVSGYEKDRLTVLKTDQQDLVRYDFVWTTTGEQGERLGRGVILDDGDYHYCMSVLRDPEGPDTVCKDLFRSFCLL